MVSKFFLALLDINFQNFLLDLNGFSLTLLRVYKICMFILKPLPLIFECSRYKLIRCLLFSWCLNGSLSKVGISDQFCTLTIFFFAIWISWLKTWLAFPWVCFISHDLTYIYPSSNLNFYSNIFVVSRPSPSFFQHTLTYWESLSPYLASCLNIFLGSLYFLYHLLESQILTT